jgi:hypothetical protein
VVSTRAEADHDRDDPYGEAFAIRDVRSIDNDAILNRDMRSRLERTG